MLKTINGYRPQISPLKRGFSPCRVLGLDTETETASNGLCKIISIQTSSGVGHSKITFTRPEHALGDLMDILFAWCKRGEVNVIFAHKLSYDLSAILLGHPEWLDQLAETGHLKLTWSTDAELEIFAGRIWFARGHFGKNRRFAIYDSLRFTFCSLDQSLKLFGIPYAKRTPPPELGHKRFSESDADFCAYAIADAEAEYLLGEEIVKQHELYDVPVSPSVASMAARIFRRDYLTDSVPKMPWQSEQQALRAFHGGLTQAVKGFYTDLYEYDISSAYPAAMMELGIPESISFVKSFAGVNGVYHVRGYCTDKEYPCLWSDDFVPLYNEQYAFVTGYELASAIKLGEFKGRVLRGYVINFRKGDQSLQHFVRDFFLKKLHAKREGNLPAEHFSKRIMNSLFGKFIQNNFAESDNGFECYKPGGLWNPMLAACITGYTHSRVHQLQHVAQSVHTATDAIKTHAELATGEGLGELHEVCKGDCLVLRGRAYAHRDTASGKWKFAAHGLGAAPRKAWVQLLSSARSGLPQTSVTRPVTIAEARQRSLPPLAWIKLTQVLKESLPKYPATFADSLLN
jgi:hypothetical protein